MLKKFGQRPGVQRTFRFSSRTPQYIQHVYTFKIKKRLKYVNKVSKLKISLVFIEYF